MLKLICWSVFILILSQCTGCGGSDSVEYRDEETVNTVDHPTIMELKGDTK